MLELWKGAFLWSVKFHLVCSSNPSPEMIIKGLHTFSVGDISLMKDNQQWCEHYWLFRFDIGMFLKLFTESILWDVSWFCISQLTSRISVIRVQRVLHNDRKWILPMNQSSFQKAHHCLISILMFWLKQNCPCPDWKHSPTIEFL